MGKECFIGIDKSIPMGCIIPASEVVQPGFLIVNVSTITERVAHAERVRKRTGRAQRLAPCIVLVFYNKIAIVVKNTNDISLEIVDVGIDRAIESHFCRTGLRIVEEMQLISMLNLIEVGVVYLHVRKQLAMVSVVRSFGIPAVLEYLLDTHTVVVALEGEGLSFAGHFLELSAGCPFVRPTTIVERIADYIVRNSSAVVRRQLIFPIRITIGVRNGLNRSTKCSGSVGVFHLASDVAATIVVIDPRRILMRIVHSDQLPKRIVGIGRGQISALLGDDVAATVVGVLEGNTVLGNLLHQRRSAVRTIRVVDILISAGQLACRIAAFGGSGRDSAEVVVGIGDLLGCAVVLDFGYSVIAVVGVLRGMDFVAGFLGELFEVAEFVVLQQRPVEHLAGGGFLQLGLARAIGLVVVRARNSAEVIVLDLRGCAIVVSLIYH